MPEPASNPPRVSVIMAVYNSAQWLQEAIDSVLTQTFQDFELLVHDDGSKDGSLPLLNAYSARDPRIKVTTAPNAGSAAARNSAIARARGEYLAIMDADDISYPDRFAQQVAYLDAHPEIAVLGSRVRVVDNAGRPVHYDNVPLDHDAIDARNMEGRTALVQPSVMMRRKAFLDVGGYDESFRNAQDTELWLRMGERYKLANCAEVLLDYRFHPYSISAKKNGDTSNNTRARQLAARRRGLSEDSVKPLSAWNWRPAPDPKSRSDFFVDWAWKARGAGFKATSRHYFLQAIRLRPLALHPWKNMIGAFLRDKGVLK